MRRAKPRRTDAIDLLKQDHRAVKDLFDRFEKSHKKAQKEKIVRQAIQELKVHALVEESLFYPAMRKAIKDPEGIMEEADEEHHVAKVLIAELELMSGDEEAWEAKFLVLAESVRHHIEEEEGKMFPKAAKAGVDLQRLGEQMQEFRLQASANEIPEDDETRMVKAAGVRAESPAKAAERSVVVPMTEKKPGRGGQEGKIGYALAWLLGVPIPVLIVVFLLRGCN